VRPSLTLGGSRPLDVKVVRRAPGAGRFRRSKVVDRGGCAGVENEPLSGNNLASRDAGVGLPPTIPPGMRAISVKVNEVIGVAGFVVPGTRVDVMAIVHDNNKALARVVVSNVQVLTAGTRYDQEAAREGKALQGTSVVTLMVSPQDAELAGLAARRPLCSRRNRSPSVTPSSGTCRETGGHSRLPNRFVRSPARRVAPRRAAAARALRALGTDDVDLGVHHPPVQRDVVLFLLEVPDLRPQRRVVQGRQVGERAELGLGGHVARPFVDGPLEGCHHRFRHHSGVDHESGGGRCHRG
jgi:hypothetical protein